MSNNSLELYILKLIKKREGELINNRTKTYNFGGIQCPIYTERAYWNKFYMLTGQIDDLYMCLTAHDNNYNK